MLRCISHVSHEQLDPAITLPSVNKRLSTYTPTAARQRSRVFLSLEYKKRNVQEELEEVN